MIDKSKEQQKKPQPTALAVKCSSNHVAKQLCINQACIHKRAFTCFNFSCKCQEEHSNCHKGNVSYVADQIKHKLSSPTGQIRADIEKTFDQIIDKISDCRHKILMQISQIEREIDFSALTVEECKFMEIVEDAKNDVDFTGKEGKKVWDIIKKKSSDSIGLFKDIRKELERYQKSLSGEMEFHFKKMNEVYFTFEVNQKGYLKARSLANPKKAISRAEQILEDSSIIKSEADANKLLEFFPRKVSSITLVFRASKNNFNMNSYFEICGQLTETVVICVTDKDKIIGGFSPLAHMYTSKGYEKEQNGQYEHDASREGFIFSLTNGDKFSLKNEFRAIFRAKDASCISFGASEFRIQSASDNQSLGCTMVSKIYQNQNYKKTDPKFFEMLNGNNTQKFTAKEWEVWQVQMKK